MIKFNFQYIKNLASPGVWRRGYDYYQKKQVEKVEQTEQGIYAKVKGNFRDEYNTHLIFHEDKVTPECDCPFPDAWCKHAVAVGLIGISQGLWDKYWGIEDEAEPEEDKNVSYEGSYRVFLSEKSKPKNLALKILDREKNQYVTDLEQLLRAVIAAQKQNALDLNDKQKAEFQLMGFIHKVGSPDKNRKQFYVPYTYLDQLVPCLGMLEDLRYAGNKKKLIIEKNPLKLVMNVNLSMIGNVLVALHWNRVNPDDIFPYEEVKLFGKKIQWGLYKNTLFPIETSVGELPKFLARSTFLDIRGSDGGKFLFEQLPRYKEELKGQIVVEEEEAIKNARLANKKPKKVLSLDLAEDNSAKITLEFDYDGMRIPYEASARTSSYVCVVKNAPPPKQYSIEEFREQEAAKLKADVEAGLVDPSELEKTKKKVIRVKVVDKSKYLAKTGSDSKKDGKFSFGSAPFVLANDQNFAEYEDVLATPEPIKVEEEKKPVLPAQKVVSKPQMPMKKEKVTPQVEKPLVEEGKAENVLPKKVIKPVEETFISKEETVLKPKQLFVKPEKLDLKEKEKPSIPEKTKIASQKEAEKTTPTVSFKQKTPPAIPPTDLLGENLFLSEAELNPLSTSRILKRKDVIAKNKAFDEMDLLDRIFMDKTKQMDMTAEFFEEIVYPNEKNEQVPDDQQETDGVVPSDPLESVDVPSEQKEPDEIYWIKRDVPLEKETYQSLLDAGLTPMQTNKLSATGDNVIDFVGKFLQNLDDEEWILEYPEEINRIRIADHSFRFKIEIDFAETVDTFIIRVASAVGKREVPLDEVQNLLKDGRKYLYAKGEGYAEIPLAQLLQFNRLLNTFDANKIDEERFRILTFKVGLITELMEMNVELIMSPRFQDFWDKISTFSNFEAIELPENLNATLRDYQQKGYGWLYFLYTYGLNGILADDMGLGKTLQSLAMILKAKQEHGSKPTLVIAPTSVVFNWEDEIRKFTPDLKSVNFTGPDRHSKMRYFNSSDVILTSYALIIRDIDLLKKYHFRHIILDESQKIKNHQSLTASVAKKLRSDHRLALSGTPIENKLSELWSVFDYLMPGFLYDFEDFKSKYALPIEEHNNKEAQSRLKKQVYPFILRRLKENVVKDLPDKLEFVQYCDLTKAQRELYADTLDYTREEIFRQIERDGFAKSQVSILTALLRLRQICCHPKLLKNTPGSEMIESGKFEELKGMITEVIEQKHRILLFSQFVEMLDLVKNWLIRDGIKFEYLTGQTKDRKEVVDRFNNDESIPIFLLSLKAGGTGLNLTGADYVIHYDPWWNPAVEDQATDRAHRIGQTKKVFVYRMITKGTVEEKIIKLQERKRDLVDSIISVDTSLNKVITYDDLKEILTLD